MISNKLAWSERIAVQKISASKVEARTVKICLSFLLVLTAAMSLLPHCIYALPSENVYSIWLQ